MKSQRRRIVIWMCGLVFGVAASSLFGNAQSKKILRIAAASDLQPVMPALAQAYEKETGVKLEVSFASSSALATQIVNGAPVDVFLGADFSFPEKVVAAGLADEKQPEAYATGTLVLWRRKDSTDQPIGMDQLSDGRITRVAVADEFHAPYGRAAYAAMRQMKLLDAIRGKLVTAENVSQAGQFVESGNAQVGFVSLTLANSEHMANVGSYVRVPAVYPKIRQCGVVIKKSPRLEEAREFMKWMLSPKVQSNLSKFGLDPVR